MTRLADVFRGRLGRFVVACAVLYGFVAAATGAPFLILLLNGIAVSVAGGVCVAYAPVFVDALRSDPPTRGDYLGAGIFLVSASVFGVRVLSFVARDLGWPEVYNTDWMTAPLWVGIIGGFFHLWAPVAGYGGVPHRRWVGSGAVVAVGILIAFVAWSIHVSTGGAAPVVVLR